VAHDERRIPVAPNLEQGVKNGCARPDLDFEVVEVGLRVASPEPI
jgi:hypothetical protein